MRDRLLELHTNEAGSYTIYRDRDHREKLEFRREPVYVWTNPVRPTKQDGALFVWTWKGRAEVLGCFFSFPGGNGKRRRVARASVVVTRGARREPSPAARVDARGARDRADGHRRRTAPAKQAARRLLQMRELTRDFSATTEDDKGKRWELRMLPKPLYRYDSTDPDVVDGAVFSFVTSAGTDPEALVVLEAPNQC